MLFHYKIHFHQNIEICLYSISIVLEIKYTYLIVLLHFIQSHSMFINLTPCVHLVDLFVLINKVITFFIIIIIISVTSI